MSTTDSNYNHDCINQVVNWSLFLTLFEFTMIVTTNANKDYLTSPNYFDTL